MNPSLSRARRNAARVKVIEVARKISELQPRKAGDYITVDTEKVDGSDHVTVSCANEIAATCPKCGEKFSVKCDSAYEAEVVVKPDAEQEQLMRALELALVDLDLAEQT